MWVRWSPKYVLLGGSLPRVHVSKGNGFLIELTKFLSRTAHLNSAFERILGHIRAIGRHFDLIQREPVESSPVYGPSVRMSLSFQTSRSSQSCNSAFLVAQLWIICPRISEFCLNFEMTQTLQIWNGTTACHIKLYIRGIFCWTVLDRSAYLSLSPFSLDEQPT